MVDEIYQAAFIDELQKIASLTPTETSKLKRMSTEDIAKLKKITPSQLQSIQSGAGWRSFAGSTAALGALVLGSGALARAGEKLTTSQYRKGLIESVEGIPVGSSGKLHKGYKSYIKALEKTPVGSKVVMKSKTPILRSMQKPIGGLFKDMSKAIWGSGLSYFPIMLAAGGIPAYMYARKAIKKQEQTNLAKRIKKI